MSLVVRVVLAAIKCGLSDKIENTVMKKIVEKVYDLSADKVKKIYTEYKNRIENALSDVAMEEQKIPQDARKYIKAEILDLLVKIDLEKVAQQTNYDIDTLKIFLIREYRDGKTYMESLSEIEKMLGVVAARIIEIVENGDQFDIHMLEIIYEECKNMQDGVENIEKKVNKIDCNVKQVLENIKEIAPPNKSLKSSVANHNGEYRENWNKNLFLNDFHKRDEFAGTNIKLSEMYILPNYIWKENVKISTDLEKMMLEVSQETNIDKRMLVVLGQPGVGKSSLIAWFLNQDEIICSSKRDTLVYRFSDLKNIDWDSENIVERILSELQIDYQDLSNKILFLDGFDEVYVQSNREDVLNALYDNLAKSHLIENFSLLVTCRVNYLFNVSRLRCNYMILQPFDKQQIKTYFDAYIAKTNMNREYVSLDMFMDKKEIFGIPIVLYMTLALQIKVDKESSVVDVYDRIFSKEGGIYDRVNLKSQPHRIRAIVEKVHQMSREFAVWIFQNNSTQESIPATQYREIVKSKVEEDISEDILIGNYFNVKHCEGKNTQEIFFVHRSIYEYFVVEAICNEIEELLNTLNEKDKKVFAEKLIPFIQQGTITPTIGEYLRHKIEKKYQNLDTSKKLIFYSWLEDILCNMVEKGILYFSNKMAGEVENIIEKESNCFSNYIIILQFLSVMKRKKYIMQDKFSPFLSNYFRAALSIGKYEFKNYLRGFYWHAARLNGVDMCASDLSGSYLKDVRMQRANLERSNLENVKLCQANLEGACMENIYMHHVCLEHANLDGANLREADLSEANLKRANLCRAYLFRANLRGVNLLEVNMTGANLSGVDFTGANLSGANLSGAHLEGANLTEAKLYETKIGHKYKKIFGLETIDLNNAEMYEDDCDMELRDDFKERGVIFVKREDEATVYF